LASDIGSSSWSWSAASLADLRPETVTERTATDLQLTPVEHHRGPGVCRNNHHNDTLALP
jgi:hypothetical protein